MVTGVRANGGRVRLAGASGEQPAVNLVGPANLRPGQSAQVALTTTYGCAAQSCSRATYTAVFVGIGSSGKVRFDFPRGQPFTAVNGVGASAFGVPKPASQGLVSSPLNALTVSFSLPSTLTEGTTASYSVTLHNPASHAVSLRPCPSYQEFLAGPGAAPAAGMHRYYLNCQAVSQIPAHGSVTFGMRIPVPATPGVAKFGWALQGTSVIAGRAVMIASR